MAAGLRIAEKNLPAFARAFAEYAAQRLAPEDLVRSLRVDAEATLADLSLPVVEQLEKLAPFGQGNPRPRVALRHCRVLAPPQRLGRGGETVSFIITQGNAAAGAPAVAQPAVAQPRLRCVAFGKGSLADRLKFVDDFDLVGQPVINRFNGNTSVELHVDDVAGLE
jgi:single-stranded-DNA-specific exonuclease